MSCFFLAAFKILSLPLSFDQFNYNIPLTFDNLIIMFLFGFLLFGAFWASWIRLSVLLLRLGKFSVIIPLNKLSAPFSLSLSCFGVFYNVNIDPLDVVPLVP